MEKITFNLLMKYIMWSEPDGMKCKFVSSDESIQKNFECDFVCMLTYGEHEQTYLYVQCFEPQDIENQYFTLMRWDGSLLYRGQDMKEVFTIAKNEFSEIRKIPKQSNKN